MKSGGESLPGIAYRVRGGIIRGIDLVSIARDEAGEPVKVGAKTWKDRWVPPVRGGTPTGGFSESGGEVFEMGLAGKIAAVRKCQGHPR